jgi:methionyl-tRNA formyltransferase
MKILFMGTPDFCVAFLKAIVPGHNIVGIVTKPVNPHAENQRKNSGSELIKYAVQNCIFISQPENLNDGAFISRISSLVPDIILVIAYGKKLPQKLLSLPAQGCINVHFSLLPEYRGPAPVSRVLLGGEEFTGVTTMFMDENIDTGMIILQEKVAIDENDNYLALLQKLVNAGCTVLIKTLELVEAGKATALAQDFSVKHKKAELIKKEDMKFEWHMPASQIHNIIRASYPSGAWFETRLEDGKKKILKVLSSDLHSGAGTCEDTREKEYEPGMIVEADKDGSVVVKCGPGCIRIKMVQAESRAKCSAYDYLLGARLKKGDSITDVK